jgi:hypothetical protein
MNYPKKSRKLLIVATTLMIITLASVLTVYATVILGTISGDAVTVHGVATGTITYNVNLDGSGTWSSILEPAGAWYTKLTVDSGYNGPVSITWKLQSYATGSWATIATVPTTFTLSGSSRVVYATVLGDITGNHNWRTEASAEGTYRVIAEINSVSSP